MNSPDKITTMSQKEATKLIQEIETRLAQLKIVIGLTPGMVSMPVKKATRKAGSGTKRGGSTEPIKKLIDEGFFSAPRSAQDVKERLVRKALNFPTKDLGVTLMRLVRSEVLERIDGDGTSKNPWRYKKA